MVVSLNSRFESNKEEEDTQISRRGDSRLLSSRSISRSAGRLPIENGSEFSRFCRTGYELTNADVTELINN